MFGINRGGWNSCSPPRAFLKVMVNFFYSSALTLCSSEHLEGRWCGTTLAARWSACLFNEMPLFVDVEERRRRARCYTHANGWQASIRFSSLLDATWVQLWETEVDSDGVMDWVEKGQLNIPIPGVH